MSNVLNRTSKQYLTSVNTPDFPTADWVINPDVSALLGVVPTKYWFIDAQDDVTEMTQPQKDVVDHDDSFFHSSGTYVDFRNSLITTHEPNWFTTLTTAEKQELVRNFVYPSEETTANLNILWTAQERSDFAAAVMTRLNAEGCLIRKSTTSGAERYFDHGADDTATLATNEVVTDVVMVKQYV